LFQVSFFEALHAEICSHGLLTPWNIASWNSPKSFFKTLRRQIMICKGHWPT
jgi:hypothetical protein